MVGPGGEIRRAFFWGMLGVAILMVATTAVCHARTHRSHVYRNRDVSQYQPATAAIVVDANSGTVMEESNADSQRHPASLTKIMTLYLLFETLNSGKLKMSGELPVSVHAAEQAPTKLGLKAGETITIDSAIRGIVTRSANDAAVVVAEALGGDEANFSKMMTAKARALGMTHTIYHNASGLPDDQQVTTARDQSILARAMHDRFHQYYHYFSTRSFEFRGVTIRNHNRLLGRIDGVDGIKTGYIRASGFNMVTSVQRGQRRIIVVVFGGRTANIRDARVIDLINNHIKFAAVKRTAPPVLEGWAATKARDKKKLTERSASEVPLPTRDPRAQFAAASAAMDDPAIGSSVPIEPTPVRTLTIHTVPTQIASAEPVAWADRQALPTTIPNRHNDFSAAAPLFPPLWPDLNSASLGGQSPKPAPPAETEPASKHNGAWIIQIGAFDDENEAKQHLASVQNKVKRLLGSADPFTERIKRGDKDLYRARFAGLDKTQAQTACQHLKRSDIPCLLLRN